MKAVQGSRGSAEFPPPLRFCNCTEVVAVVHKWWLTIFGWLHLLSPSTVQVFWKCWGAAAHRACEGSSCQPQPADGPLCSPTTHIHTPQENVDFIRCRKLTITWSQFMGPFYFWCIFSDLHNSPGWHIRALLAHESWHPLVGSLWVIAAGEGRGELWSQLTVREEWGVWEALL